MNLRQSLTDTEWKDLLASGSRRSFAPGAPLMHQGDESDHVVALIQGTVKVTEATAAGQVHPVALRGSGELLGDVGVLLEQPRTASVWSVNRCVGHAIPASAFRRLERRHQLTATLLRFTLQRSMEKDRHLRSFRCDTRDVRLARLLADFAQEVGEREGRRTAIHLGMNRAELASMLGMSRATLHSALTSLQRRELITCRRMRIDVADVEALTLHASQDMVDVS